MTETDKLIEASARKGMTGEAIAAGEAIREALSDYSNCLSIFAHEEGIQPVAFPGPKVEVRGQAIVSWRCYPATFMECVASLIGAPDKKKWQITRAAEQLTGMTASGTEVMITEADIRAMRVDAAQVLLAAISLHGDESLQRKPQITEKGDGIQTPIVFELGRPIGDIDKLEFMAKTVGQLEEACAGGDLTTQVYGLFMLANDGYIMHQLAPADGWALLTQVLPLIKKAGKPVLDVMRSYEYVIRVQFDHETPLGVMMDKQAAYAKMHKAKIKSVKKGKRR